MSAPTERERRAHVRMRPIAELPARITLRPSSGNEVLAVVHDISLGGVGAVLSDEISALEQGTQVQLALDLGSFGRHAIEGRVRHKGRDEPGVLGTEFVKLEGEAYAAVKRYLAELLERGAFS